jgi:hypothetical protein
MIHSREAVLRAIEECDRLGRDEFLARYGYRRSKSYLLVHNGKSYDSKAIVGVAYGFENPGEGPLKSGDFVGGANTVQRWLERLGFTVQSDSQSSGQTQHPSKPLKPPERDLPPPSTASVVEMCATLHSWFNRLPVFEFPVPLDQIPRNGIYVLFEEGERGHGTNRIVRIGTHTGDGQLPSRLNQHFVNENKDRSIFRKNIGRCLLNRDGDPFLKDWERDLTTRAARDAYESRIDFAKQQEVEKRVSEYMRSRFRFAVFEVAEKEIRLWLESRIVSTISRCDECSPSPSWLGLHSTKRKIREGGLWQVNELGKTPFSTDELRELGVLLRNG